VGSYPQGGTFRYEILPRKAGPPTSFWGRLKSLRFSTSLWITPIFHQNLPTRFAEDPKKESRLRWHDWERYSTRQEEKMKLGGFMGRIDFSGDFAPFWGYLVLGEIVHVGKGSSFGLGKYEILRDEIEGVAKI